MRIQLHPHAKARLLERGATESEVSATVEGGERFLAAFGRTGFRRSFSSEGLWQNRPHSHKRVEAFAVEEGDGWLVITVAARYF